MSGRASPRDLPKPHRSLRELPFFALVFAGIAAGVFYLVGGWWTLRAAGALSEISLSDVPPGATRPPPGCWEEPLIPPGSAMDSRWWVTHARMLLQEGSWRVRHTPLDNAPEGREVHWSSGPVWLLALMGRAMGSLTGQPAASWLARCSLVAGPLLGVFGVAGLAFLGWRWRGGEVGAVLAAVLVTSEPVTRAFAFGDFDHHGLVALLAAASAWCVMVGGAGCAGGNDLPPRAAAFKAFAASGILGAAALWVSAATAIPIIGGLMVGGFLTGLAAMRSCGKKFLVPELWRRWGYFGAAGSLAFYALEYFPANMGMRLEVNHPLYALAWAGAGHLLASVLEWISGVRRWSWRRGVGMAAAGLAVAAPFLLILVGSNQFFWVADAYLLEIHRKYIYEFQSLPTLFQASGAWRNLPAYAAWPIAFAFSAAGIFLQPSPGKKEHLGLWVLLPAVFLMGVMSWVQARWLSAFFPLVAVGVAMVWAGTDPTLRLGLGIRWMLAGAAWLSLLAGPLPEMQAQRERGIAIERGQVSGADRGSLFVRDVAVRLLQASPRQAPLVLAGPNISTELAYHTGIRVVGTLYWENLPGLRRGAEIYSAAEAEEVFAHLRKAGVSHLLLTSWDPFAFLLPAAAGSTSDQIRRSYLARVFAGEEEYPDWLRPLAYPIPEGDRMDVDSVRLFAVVPEQGRAEALAYRGLFEEEAGRRAEAITLYERALEADSTLIMARQGLSRLGHKP